MNHPQSPTAAANRHAWAFGFAMPVLLAISGCVIGDLAPGRAQITMDGENTPCFGLPAKLLAVTKNPRLIIVVVEHDSQTLWSYQTPTASAPPTTKLACIPFNTAALDASGAAVRGSDSMQLDHDAAYFVTVVARDPANRSDRGHLVGHAYFCMTKAPDGTMQLRQADRLDALRCP